MSGDAVIEQQVEQMISELVERFYARARQDVELGPIFDAAIGDGWAEHLERLKNFWASVAMGAGRYKGSPMMAHMMLPQRLTTGHFGRWLELWRVTATEVCGPRAAAPFIARAEMMAERLLAGIDMHHAAIQQNR